MGRDRRRVHAWVSPAIALVALRSVVARSSPTSRRTPRAARVGEGLLDVEARVTARATRGGLKELAAPRPRPRIGWEVADDALVTLAAIGGATVCRGIDDGQLSV
jgi:hypothetical protein